MATKIIQAYKLWYLKTRRKAYTENKLELPVDNRAKQLEW